MFNYPGNAIDLVDEIKTLIIGEGFTPDEVNNDPIDCLKQIICRTKTKIICLCGSTRFGKEFEEANARFTLEGNIVLSVGCFGYNCLECGASRADHPYSGCEDFVSLTEEQKKQLDALHFRKIELADQVHFLNVGGYIGESTRNELNYAKSLGKEITYHESTNSDNG